ncbi:Fe2+-dependent dioxygenase [Pusillimonas sp. TS35]|uniref:Fe2+-dependent dioxygenase n=1 Tax=Paracandidimonas lactea TaxID=2895524 RepID=UPI00136D4A89|nr:Fe2+-dependent dioxygenase [Paracandidimonas lactea]MYN13084.1 Fe2+-dependent dioxygenase [Pusillimonas sp. TS35]
MMHTIPDVLSADQVAQCRTALEQAQWADGRVTAGHVAIKAKHNLQLPLDHPVARQLGQLIMAQLAGNTAFISAALPLRILPPRFNRYEGGGNYGNHIDNAIFGVPGSGERVRSDVSSTLFLSDPDEYDGGELIVGDTFGEHRVKLPAGHMVVYPGSSLHRVTPVTRGTRLAAFFWTQSLVREDHRRALLWQLDDAIQQLTASAPDHGSIPALTGVYHNLVREWSET